MVFLIWVFVRCLLSQECNVMLLFVFVRCFSDKIRYMDGNRNSSCGIIEIHFTAKMWF